jgi:CBS domain-containing protein
MTNARDIMNGLDRVGAQESVAAAAHRMNELDVDALPVCGPEGNVHTMGGMITESGIADGVLVHHRDPGTTRVGELAQHDVSTIGADEPIDVALVAMTEHHIGRLPVTDGARIIGVIDHSDVTRVLDAGSPGD